MIDIGEIYEWNVIRWRGGTRGWKGRKLVLYGRFWGVKDGWVVKEMMGKRLEVSGEAVGAARREGEGRREDWR